LSCLAGSWKGSQLALHFSLSLSLWGVPPPSHEIIVYTSEVQDAHVAGIVTACTATARLLACRTASVTFPRVADRQQ